MSIRKSRIFLDTSMERQLNWMIAQENPKHSSNSDNSAFFCTKKISTCLEKQKKKTKHAFFQKTKNKKNVCNK